MKKPWNFCNLWGEQMAKRILIVEDERVVADDIQKSLEGLGYDALCAVASGKKAIEKVEEEKPDLVLMDIVLKGKIDGIEAAAHIRSHFNIPVVFLTAYTDEKTLKRAKIAEPYGYIVKPFKDTELRAAIEMTLYKHDADKKVQQYKEQLERRMEERSGRTEILLETKKKLQEERNWEKGLGVIIESMAEFGFECCCVFLVNFLRKTLDSHLCRGFELPENISVPLQNTEYAGVRCVREKKIILVDCTPEGINTQDAHSLVWIPIVVQDEAFAALTGDNKKSRKIVTDEDVKDLEILAGICAAFIDRTRVSIAPVAERVLKTKCRHWIDPTECYILLERKPEKAFEVFCDLVTHGIPGFIISREYPQKVRRGYRLAKTPILWLSRSEVENTINPDDLSKLGYIVGDFTRKCRESVILLDGLEYLVTQTGFQTVLTYLQELKDIVVMNNSRLLIPLHKDTVSLKEYSMLEKEFNILCQ